MTDKPNGWSEHQRLVLYRLKENRDAIVVLSSKMEDVRTDIAILKVRAGIWGATAGGFVTGLVYAISHLF